MTNQYQAAAGRSIPGAGQISSLDVLAPLPPYARAAAGMQRIAQPNISGIPETQIAPELELARRGIRTETALPIPMYTGEIGVPQQAGDLLRQGGQVQAVAGNDPLSQTPIVTPAVTLGELTQTQEASPMASGGGGTLSPGLESAIPIAFSGAPLAPGGGSPLAAGGLAANRPQPGTGGGPPSGTFGGNAERLLARQAADAARRAPTGAPSPITSPETAAPVIQQPAQAQTVTQMAAGPQAVPQFVTPSAGGGGAPGGGAAPPPVSAPVFNDAAAAMGQTPALLNQSLPGPTPSAAAASPWDLTGSTPIYSPSANLPGLTQEEQLLMQMGILDPYTVGGGAGNIG